MTEEEELFRLIEKKYPISLAFKQRILARAQLLGGPDEEDFWTEMASGYLLVFDAQEEIRSGKWSKDL
mgnify:CR=1 FL=1